MLHKAIIFDFDGTLVDSNEIKINAYYDAFGFKDKRDKIIDKVLSSYPELNRYDTILKIILTCCDNNIDKSRIVAQYNKIVIESIKHSIEIKYATRVLDYLLVNNVTIYLSSNTPIDVLKEIVEYRGWGKYFSGIYGYPDNKNNTLQKIMANHKFSRDRYLVVGDGESDEESANFNNVDFFKVANKSLEDLLNILNVKVDNCD